ncbi:MAG TPA: HEAT repeat domain-containing protein [Myxococcaceae bacterium]|nr:HEAT repeat domain-containing protein [Myxococcaceae bacterium]
MLVLALTGCKGDPKTPEFWDKQINSAHRAKDKVRVVDDLRESGNANASFIPMLLGQLSQEKQAEVKGAVARVLGSLKDASAVGPLTDSIDMGSTDSAGNAMNKDIAAALGKIGDAKATPTLMRLIKARDNYVKIEAINALGALHAKEAAEPLLDIVQDDQGEPFICKKAIQALGEIGDPKSIPLLIQMMFKERRGVSFYPESSFALFQIGRPASDALIAVVKGEDKRTWSWVKENNILEPAVYAKAAQVLGDLHEKGAQAALLKQLSFNSDFLDLKLFVRMKAADALGRLRVKEAVKPLSGMLDEDEATARLEYIRALEKIGGRDAIPALLKSAAKGSWDAREPAMIGVAMLGDEREISSFERYAKDEEKLTAAECKENPDYAGCKDPAALTHKHVEAIQTHQKRLEAAKECKADAACWVKKLEDPAPGVRERAAMELGHSGKGDTVAELLKHLKEPNLDARSAVIQATDWLVTEDKAAARTAQGSSAAIDKQLDEEHGKTEFVKVNEDLKRLAVDVKRQSA